MTNEPGAEAPTDPGPVAVATASNAAGAVAGPTSDEAVGTKRRWWRTKWVFTRRLCFGGLAGALVFFCLSMTPTLLPRAEVMQGLVSGVAAGIGYGFGSLLSSIIRKLRKREPSSQFKRRAWWVLAGATLVLGGGFVIFGVWWQRDVRNLMGADQLAATSWLLMILLSVVVFLLVMLVARVLRGTTRALIRFLDRFWPHHVTVWVGVGTVTVLALGFTQGVLLNGMVSAVNAAYSVTDRDTNPWISQPTSTLRSGGPESLVDWQTLGIKGRDYTGVGNAPTPEDIEAFTGEPALEPIRVYVGLDSAPTLRERVDLAMAELERTGAFDRKVLLVNTTTGTGWVDENVVDSIEFLHGGDVAQVAMQYSFLPSWISFLVDRSKAEGAGEQMITAVTDRVNKMAPEDRPQLLVFGESLGSFGSEAAFTSPENLLSNVGGAMLVGPTFVNPLHEELTSERDEGSPSWRPVVDAGASFRFAVDPADLSDASLFPDGTSWATPRVVYLQNSSDPITYFDPDLLLSRPDWLDGERGPDVTGAMIWVPFLTFFQVAADMTNSMGVPAGHGHYYGSNVVNGWVEVSAPPGWTGEDTEALRQLIDQRAGERNAKKEAAGG